MTWIVRKDNPFLIKQFIGSLLTLLPISYTIRSLFWVAFIGKREEALKRVLVLRCENLLAAGVESLLAREHDLLVLGVNDFSDDRFSFVQEIEFFHPNVVILDESALFSDFSFVYDILKKHPKIRFIIVDEADNLVHIFDKQVMMVAQSTDLVEIIRIDGNDPV